MKEVEAPVRLAKAALSALRPPLLLVIHRVKRNPSTVKLGVGLAPRALMVLTTSSTEVIALQIAYLALLPSFVPPKVTLAIQISSKAVPPDNTVKEEMRHQLLVLSGFTALPSQAFPFLAPLALSAMRQDCQRPKESVRAATIVL